MDTVVVWNLDARYRPELEVELDIVCLPHEIPGAHLALMRPELEVEMIAMNDEVEMIAMNDEVFDEDGWFISEGDVVPDELVA